MHSKTTCSYFFCSSTINYLLFIRIPLGTSITSPLSILLNTHQLTPVLQAQGFCLSITTHDTVPCTAQFTSLHIGQEVPETQASCKRWPTSETFFSRKNPAGLLVSSSEEIVSTSCDRVPQNICVTSSLPHNRTKENPVQKGHNLFTILSITLHLPTAGQCLMEPLFKCFLSSLPDRGQGPCLNPVPVLFCSENIGWLEPLGCQECQSPGNNPVVGRLWVKC